MPYSGEKYEYLFNQDLGELSDNAFEVLRHKDVFRYKTKQILSGDVLEIEIYPIWNMKTARAAKSNKSREAQKKLNEKNAKKALIRKINANFTDQDIHVTLTYGGRFLPNEAEARRDIRNFMRRVRNYRKKNKLPELKYIYVIEFSDGDGRRTRVHHHVIMSGMDRKAVKSLWQHGRAEISELEPEAGTLEGLARYITKQSGGKSSKRWACSRHLKPYTKKSESETKISRRQAEKLAQDVRNAAPQIFGKNFKGFNFDRCTVNGSDVVAGAYIYTHMNKAKSKHWKGHMRT